MKRRHFLKGIGIGASSLLAMKQVMANGMFENADWEVYHYPAIDSLEDARTKEGQIIVRIELSADDEEGIARSSGKVAVKGAKTDKIKSYFFEYGDDDFDENKGDFTAVLHRKNLDVMVTWLDDANEATEVEVTANNKSFFFSLKEIVDQVEKNFVSEGVRVKVNLLLDKEMGEIHPKDFGGKDPGDEFIFTALADPQGGADVAPDNPDNLRTRIKIHNAFIEESIALVNRLEKTPVFTMVIGDVCDAWGYDYDLKKMNEMLGKLNHPVLYEIGNHETLLKSKFGPGYNMDAFTNYLSAQKAINGLDKLLYSFNMGQWHFVVWPDPLRNNFWETHPHYFDWLERDLEKYKDRPTMIFQHVPVHPIGITPHINYAESVFVKKTYLDIISKQGNVKYVLSGHVHIPVKAAFKTAVTYKGIKLINLPAAGYRSRNFGEEDFYGGPAQGAAIVEIKGKDAVIKYKTVTEDQYTFPEVLPEFDDETYALWLRYKWELPAEKQVVNGNFENGLKGWAKRYCYTEDESPANFCETRQMFRDTSFYSLYLFSKRRGYQAPGQDRYPQDVNRISQAVKTEKNKSPYFSFNYMLDGKNCDFNGYAGAYVWFEGFCGAVKKLGMCYSAHKIWVNIGGKFAGIHEVWNHHFALNEEVDKWHNVVINLKEDYENKTEKSFDELNIDRIVITLGTWNLNDGPEQPFGMYIDDIKLKYDLAVGSNINDVPIKIKPKEDEWWRGLIWENKNLSGEHRYVVPTDWKID